MLFVSFMMFFYLLNCCVSGLPPHSCVSPNFVCLFISGGGGDGLRLWVMVYSCRGVAGVQVERGGVSKGQVVLGLSTDHG